MVTFVIIGIIFFIYICFEPYIDVTENNIILWYDSGGDRDFIILWSRETK